MAKKMKSMDGNTATTHVAYALSDTAAIYPITPSSTMGEIADEWAAKGMRNIFGQDREPSGEMQSEAGAAGAVHGSLAAGALTTTFTASQGLLLMIPNMYKIAGELLARPCSTSRPAPSRPTPCPSSATTQDVMACRLHRLRHAGLGLKRAGVHGPGPGGPPVGHRIASVPFVHFFDGFRTSATRSRRSRPSTPPTWPRPWSNFDKVAEFRKKRHESRSIPVLRGTAQNPDIYFQGRERSNPYYQGRARSIVIENMMEKVGKLTGRKYKPFDYVGRSGRRPERHRGHGLGSCETIQEVINYVMAAKGEEGRPHQGAPVPARLTWTSFFKAVPASRP